MKFTKYSLLIITGVLVLILFVTGYLQFVDAQPENRLGSASYSLASDSHPDTDSSVSINPSEAPSSVFSSGSTSITGPADSEQASSSNASSFSVSSGSISAAVPRPTKAAVPTAPAPTAAVVPSNALVLDGLIGQTEAQVVGVMGQPSAKELSEYGFTWYVYHSNYARFVMIGISGGKVVGVYSNSGALNFSGLSVGLPRAAVRTSLSAAAYGSPLTSIQKGSTRYPILHTDEKDVFYNGTAYATVFYDNSAGGTLTAIQIIEKSAEWTIGYYGTPSTALEAGFEKINFYLINAIRVRKGLACLTWDTKLAVVAKSHSVEMLSQGYFDHVDMAGLSSAGRFTAAGIGYSLSAENIAQNIPSPILTHELFMNSAGHRNNILNASLTSIGIGTALSGSGMRLTQDFIR